MNIKEQFIYKVPGDWGAYLWTTKGLETFSFYPLLTAILMVIGLAAATSFIIAKVKRHNRPFAKFFKLMGKWLIGEAFAGLFLMFSRWQTLGIFAIRLLLFIWLITLPIVAIVFVVLYFRKFRKEIEQAAKEGDLSKYKPH